MSVRKRGKYYHIVLEKGRDADGKRIQEWMATEFTRKADAQAKEEELKFALRKGTYIKPTKKTVGEFLIEWLEDRKSEIKASTWEHYDWLRRLHVDPVIGQVELMRLSPANLLDVYRKAKEIPSPPKSPQKGRGAVRKKAVSPTTINAIHRFG